MCVGACEEEEEEGGGEGRGWMQTHEWRAWFSAEGQVFFLVKKFNKSRFFRQVGGRPRVNADESASRETFAKFDALLLSRCSLNQCFTVLLHEKKKRGAIMI